MFRSDGEELEKTTVNLRAGDMAFLKDVGHPKGIGASFIIRKIVSEWVDARRPKSETAAPDIDI